MIRYQAIHGRQADKFTALAGIDLHDDSWRAARTDWQAPLTPAAAGAWDEFPALSDLMPWVAPGVKANRTWVYAPSREILRARWKRLVEESDMTTKRGLFKETRDSNLHDHKPPLPASALAPSQQQIAKAGGAIPSTIRVGYRSFDRQWLIADSRVIDQPRPPLWAARSEGQCFVVEQHAQQIENCPGVVFSALIPDMHHFNNRGGRVLPMLHPNGAANVAPGLLDALGTMVGSEPFSGSLPIADLVAYLAGVVAHPGYTTRFADELTTPGVRVPLTADPALWAESVALGRTVVWAQTYGDCMADAQNGRPTGNVRFPADDERRIRNFAAVTGMPATIGYDEPDQRISLGTGTWGPVSWQVFDYDVGGKNVIRSWFNYRKAVPGGKKTSPLDHMHVDAWPGEWSSEFTDLLTLLTRLVEAETAQADLLNRIMDGPLLTMGALTEYNVRWPTVAAHRKPRFESIARQADPPAGQLF